VADLEDRIRSAFASVMDPPEGAGHRIRDAALGSLEPTPRRRAARWARRALRPVPAIATALGVAAVAVVLLVAAPADRPTAPADATGVEMVVRAEPASQTERLAEVLRRRGELRGITGMTVDVADGVVHVFVPRTHDADWPAQSLLGALDAAVYDPAASVVAADRSLQAVLDAVPAPAAGAAVHWYAVKPHAVPGRSLLGGPFGDAAQARRAVAQGGRVVAVPADVAIVLTNDPIGAGTPGGFAFAALRDPIVRPGEIAAVTGGDGRLEVVVAERARARVAAALARPGAQALVAYGGPGQLPQTLSTARLDRWDAASGTLVFAVSRPRTAADGSAELARTLAPGGVDAGVTVVSSTPVGPAPVLRGDPVPADEVPAALRRMGRGDLADDPFRPSAGTVRKVLTAVWKGRPVPMYASVAVNGLELVTFGGGTGGCPVAPDFPVIFVCGGGWDGPGAPVSVNGRVGDAVTTVTAEYADGSTREATVANGFFLLLQPRAAGDPERLVAGAADGAVLGTLEAGAPGAGSLGVALP